MKDWDSLNPQQRTEILAGLHRAGTITTREYVDKVRELERARTRLVQTTSARGPREPVDFASVDPVKRDAMERAKAGGYPLQTQLLVDVMGDPGTWVEKYYPQAKLTLNPNNNRVFDLNEEKLVESPNLGFPDVSGV